ncbi:hypothetical protein [Gabonibacter massiliensis]|uniref:hypothetical protein n=1 Tax=Gabonibacter massiliensis TaxID=1720195 RepID=UPI00073EB4A8|nr:hypothetical protein [Gabonibacter massiliensis]
MINISTPNTQSALKEHLKALRPILEKRIKGLNITIAECEQIIKCKPEDMLKMFTEWKKQGKIQIKQEKKKENIIDIQYIGDKRITKIFNYAEFAKKGNEEKGKYGAYQLAKNLDIRVCPYCNRMYTVTAIHSKNEFITRPEFDHFFPQSTYPLFALSFYNLIPSCTICNGVVKGKKELNLQDYIHPYVDNNIADFNFDYIPEGVNQVKEITINVRNDSKISNTLDFFKIKKIYNEHRDVVENLIQLKDVFSIDYLKSLRDTFQLDIDEELLYPLIFDTCFNETDFHKRPFSKLKKDIVKKLNL